MENPLKIDYLGVPLLLETPIFFHWFWIQIMRTQLLKSFWQQRLLETWLMLLRRYFSRATLYCNLKVIKAAMLPMLKSPPHNLRRMLLRNAEYAEVFPHYRFGSSGYLAQNVCCSRTMLSFEWRKRYEFLWVKLGSNDTYSYLLYFSLCIVMSGRGLHTKSGYTSYFSTMLLSHQSVSTTLHTAESSTSGNTPIR